MFKAFEFFFASLSILAIAVYVVTLFGLYIFKDFNWLIVIFSNAVIIFSTLGLITIHYFFGNFNYVELITLVIWIINFAIDYFIWQNNITK